MGFGGSAQRWCWTVEAQCRFAQSGKSQRCLNRRADVLWQPVIWSMRPTNLARSWLACRVGSRNWGQSANETLRSKRGESDMPSLTRRAILMATIGLPAIAAERSNGEFEIMRTDKEWKSVLTPEQYYVLRRHGTERAGSSPLDREKRSGTFHCAGCGLPLYASEAKFDSGTGWPSFWEAIEGCRRDHNR